MPDLQSRTENPARRRGRAAGPNKGHNIDPTVAAEDRFFRQIVRSMRNGAIAFHRDGRLALMNDEAYRIFGLTRQPDDMGRPFADVLRPRPDVVRVLASTFELSHLPNRAELRLKE